MFNEIFILMLRLPFNSCFLKILSNDTKSSLHFHPRRHCIYRNMCCAISGLWRHFLHTQRAGHSSSERSAVIGVPTISRGAETTVAVWFPLQVPQWVVSLQVPWKRSFHKRNCRTEKTSFQKQCRGIYELKYVMVHPGNCHLNKRREGKSRKIWLVSLYWEFQIFGQHFTNGSMTLWCIFFYVCLILKHYTSQCHTLTWPSKAQSLGLGMVAGFSGAFLRGTIRFPAGST